MRFGIIGLPGAGRTTAFEALTQSAPAPERRTEERIVTIDVPDERIDVLSRMYTPRKTTHARIEYLLPAAAGAEAGAIPPVLRDCDALLHVVGNHTGLGEERRQPAADFARLDQELIFADLVVVEKRLERIEQDHRRGKKMDPEEHALLDECRRLLEAETPLRSRPELAADRRLRGFGLMSAKPMLVLFNNDDDDNALPALEGAAAAEQCMVIRGKLEQELAQMSAEEAEEFLREFNLRDTARQRIIRRSYQLLGLISFFTVGQDEVRAWTVTAGTPAVEAAGKIHSDLQKGFIRAEVLAYDDLVACGSYADARKKGLVRLEGKSYPVADGDIIEVRFNV